MRFAFDLHGTIDTDPEFFKKLMIKYRKKGSEVWIISGPLTKVVGWELRSLGFEQGVHYDKAIGVVSYLIEKGIKPIKIEVEGNYWFDDDEWWSSKSEICRLNNIYYLVDNEIKYAEGFLHEDNQTSFILFNATKSERMCFPLEHMCLELFAY